MDPFVASEHLSFCPCHPAALLTGTVLLPVQASQPGPSHLCAFGPLALAALQKSLWEALKCPLADVLGAPH